jgi:N-acetyl sugar amidotransferase
MITRCKLCLYPTTKPDLHFKDGVCAACLNHKAKQRVDWVNRYEDLMQILDKEKRRNAEFDCIVPSSGGKDSHYQVIAAIEMGMKPLIVTARTCHLTELGRRNIDNLAKYAPTVEVEYDPVVRAKLNRLSLDLTGDISLPEHFAIFSAPFRVAAERGITLIMYGECPTMEYGGPPESETHKTMTRAYINEHQGFLGMRARDFINLEGITSEDMSKYMLPDDSKMKNITAIFLGQYIKWSSQRNSDVAFRHGFSFSKPAECNWWPHENLDNAQTGVHDYFGYLKYGYGRGAAQLSVDIREGLMTRDDALEEARHIEGVFPEVYAGVPFDDMLNRIGMSRYYFSKVADKFTRHSLFKQRDGRLVPVDLW